MWSEILNFCCLLVFHCLGQTIMQFILSGMQKTSRRPLHQPELAPEPTPEARSARRSSQYLKPMRYSSFALSGPAPVPPALLHASSARPGRANLPRMRITAHAPAWPAAARFPCTGPPPPLPRSKPSRRAGRSFAAYQRPVFRLAPRAD